MSERLFGTDGVRGIPGSHPLLPGLMRRLGLVAARSLLERSRLPAAAGRNGSAPVVLMARDPRASGAALQRQVARGLQAAGCVPVDLGVLPTPAVSYLVPRRGALCGVVISASHNPAEFNGVKFITSEGFKMGLEAEREIEERLASQPDPDPGPGPVRLHRDDAAERDYFDYLLSTFPAHQDLSGLRVVVDCANGAACRIAPRLLGALGARVAVLGCRPDGRNINKGCGALETGAMRREVVRRGFDCGVALDGDADRAVFADERGRLCDGDRLIALAALHLQADGLLRRGKVVLTVMSNYGLIHFLKERGIGAVVVPVGDRNVTEAIEREGLSLGGEASGHIVFRRFLPAGDGLLTALQTLSALAFFGRKLGFLHGFYPSYPQVLKNLRVEERVPLERLPEFRRRVRESERGLRGRGRVLVRYSGTEPLMRILVEGPSRSLVQRIAQQLAASFLREAARHRRVPEHAD